MLQLKTKTNKNQPNKQKPETNASTTNGQFMFTWTKEKSVFS